MMNQDGYVKIIQKLLTSGLQRKNEGQVLSLWTFDYREEPDGQTIVVSMDEIGRSQILRCTNCKMSSASIP